jgi:hypothetical protein
MWPIFKAVSWTMKPPVRIADRLTKISTGYFLETSLENYLYTNMLSIFYITTSFLDKGRFSTGT